jgi:hypothetical protein
MKDYRPGMGPLSRPGLRFGSPTRVVPVSAEKQEVAELVETGVAELVETGGS